MAIDVRIARIGFFAVNAGTGAVIDKATASLAAVARSRHEHRIIVDASAPSSAGSPTVKGYLLLEATAGRRLLSLNETTVITTDNPGPFAMPLNIHIAYSRLVAVDRVGNVVDKNHRDTTIAQLLQTEHQHRVEADQDIPNTAGQPSVADYLKLEAEDNYMLSYMDQRYVITYQV